MPVFAALAFAALVAALVFDVASRIRPPQLRRVDGAWNELTEPGGAVRMDQPASWTFSTSPAPSWLWKLGRFELEVPLPPYEVAKRLKQMLRTEPAYALFLPIRGRAVGWVEDGRFQTSLIGAMSRHPSSWIAEGAIVSAGDGTILRSDFIVRKSRLAILGLFAVWIVSGALYGWLASAQQLTTSLVIVSGVVVYLGILRGASWVSGRRLQRFLIEAVSPPDHNESEPVGYAAMIRNIEDEIGPQPNPGRIGKSAARGERNPKGRREH